MNRQGAISATVTITTLTITIARRHTILFDARASTRAYPTGTPTTTTVPATGPRHDTCAQEMANLAPDELIFFIPTQVTISTSPIVPSRCHTLDRWTYHTRRCHRVSGRISMTALRKRASSKEEQTQEQTARQRSDEQTQFSHTMYLLSTSSRSDLIGA
jgi:hypothetical protein